jgi:tRNA 2-selenouridine synthase
LVDVRTPAEFAKGHIPGAINVPLFSNEERAVVGTIYKQVSKDKALIKGLEFVGPKLSEFVKLAGKRASGREVYLHCWRGGKRSASMAWLLNFSDIKTSTIEGGYKSFRRLLLDYFENTVFDLIILGGKTGSGKTEILYELKTRGEQVIDLEGLANHKGSAFGWIGEEEQPTPEQFENDLFFEFLKLDTTKRIWLENESKGIGRVYIPNSLWLKMRNTTLVNLEVSRETRIDRLVKMYSSDSRDGLLLSFDKISRRIGGLNLKEAIEAVNQNDYRKAAGLALQYYDKTYNYNLENNSWPRIVQVQVGNNNPEQIAEMILETYNKKLVSHN